MPARHAGRCHRHQAGHAGRRDSDQASNTGHRHSHQARRPSSHHRDQAGHPGHRHSDQAGRQSHRYRHQADHAGGHHSHQARHAGRRDCCEACRSNDDDGLQGCDAGREHRHQARDARRRGRREASREHHRARYFEGEDHRVERRRRDPADDSSCRAGVLRHALEPGLRYDSHRRTQGEARARRDRRQGSRNPHARSPAGTAGGSSASDHALAARSGSRHSGSGLRLRPAGGCAVFGQRAFELGPRPRRADRRRRRRAPACPATLGGRGNRRHQPPSPHSGTRLRRSGPGPASRSRAVARPPRA